MKKEGKKIALKLEHIIIYLVWIILLAVGIIESFNVSYGAIIWFLFLGFFIFLYFHFPKFPAYVHLILSLVLLFNIFGEAVFKFFYYISYYDKVIHLVNSVVICLFVYHSTKPKIKSKLLLTILCISVALSLGAVWEVIEYGLDNTLGSTTQGVYLGTLGKTFNLRIGEKEILDPFNDTIQDLMCNLFGVLIFAFSYFILNKRKMLK